MARHDVTPTKSESPWIGLGVSIGAGIGLIVGLLGWGGGGIALGLSIGAGIGIAIGASLDAAERRRHAGQERGRER
jgi:hypothetical protein